MRQISERDYKLLQTKLPALLKFVSGKAGNDLRVANDVRLLKTFVKKINKHKCL
jgi:hypothetical protein